MENRTFEQFETGNLTIGANTKAIATMPWNAHKDFPGVYLKNVVGPDQARGLFRCCLVRIEPGAEIGLHTHTDSIELHEVIAGSGVCVTENGEITYKPGSMAVLDCNLPHIVRAGDQGLRLFAKFITVSL